MNKEREIIDEFGSIIIKDVRDIGIEDIKRRLSVVFTDLMRDQVVPEELAKTIKVLDKIPIECRLQIAELAPYFVDNIISLFFEMFIYNNEKIKLTYCEEDGTEHNLEEISDRLNVELYSDEGWIMKFSKFKEIFF